MDKLQSAKGRQAACYPQVSFLPAATLALTLLPIKVSPAGRHMEIAPEGDFKIPEICGISHHLPTKNNGMFQKLNN